MPRMISLRAPLISGQALHSLTCSIAGRPATDAAAGPGACLQVRGYVRCINVLQVQGSSKMSITISTSASTNMVTELWQRLQIVS